MKKKRFCSNLLLIFFYSFDKIKDRNGNGSIIVYIFYIFLLLLFPFMFHLKFIILLIKKKIISKNFFLSLRSITSIQNSGIPGIPLKKKMKWRLCNIPAKAWSASHPSSSDFPHHSPALIQHIKYIYIRLY